MRVAEYFLPASGQCSTSNRKAAVWLAFLYVVDHERGQN